MQTSFSPLLFFSGPPAFLLVANLVEVQQIHPDGGDDQTLVKEPRGTILALDYDPVQKHVRKVPLLLVLVSQIKQEKKKNDY